MAQQKTASFAEIVAGLQSSDSEVRRKSMPKLNGMKPEEIDKSILLPLLVNILENDEKIEVKEAAASRLGFLGYREAVEPLLKAAQGENHRLKETALRAVVALRDDRCLPFLFEVVRSKSLWVRKSGIEGLHKFKNEQVFQALLDALANDPSIEVREAAAYGLGKLNDSRAIEPLLIALEKAVGLLIADKYPFDMRGEIAYALARFKEPRLFEPLVTLVKHPDKGVMAYGIDALGELGDARGVAPLVDILADPEQHPADRMAAAQGLAELKNSEPKVITALVEAMRVVPKKFHAPLAHIAAHTLSKLGEPGLAALLESAHSSDNFQRSQALIVLSSKGNEHREDERVTKTLKEALETQEGLTEKAIEYLKKWEVEKKQLEG